MPLAGVFQGIGASIRSRAHTTKIQMSAAKMAIRVGQKVFFVLFSLCTAIYNGLRDCVLDYRLLGFSIPGDDWIFVNQMLKDLESNFDLLYVTCTWPCPFSTTT